MKLQNITDVKGFFDVVNECKGTVELVTADGDVLNLKSRGFPEDHVFPHVRKLSHRTRKTVFFL